MFNITAWAEAQTKAISRMAPAAGRDLANKLQSDPFTTYADATARATEWVLAALERRSERAATLAGELERLERAERFQGRLERLQRELHR